MKTAGRTIAAALLAALLSLASASASQLRETGSTLLWPLMDKWAAAYHNAHAEVSIATASTGSGAGIAQGIAGTADIGGSDAYLSDAQASSTMNIPLAVSAQVIAYNLPDVGYHHLNLSGDMLAAIYGGSIEYWDDPRIVQSNPSQPLPHQRIVVLARSDGSGDTFIFTEYLTRSAKDWKAGFATRVNWPKMSAITEAKGSEGVVAACAKRRYSIAYLPVSYVGLSAFASLGYAALQSHDGAFLLPQPDTLEAAASTVTVPPDGRASLIDRPGSNAYPIVNYEYAIVRSHQANADRAQAIKAFLSWAIDPAGGSDQARFLSSVNFVALPTATRMVSQSLIAKIH